METLCHPSSGAPPLDGLSRCLRTIANDHRCTGAGDRTLLRCLHGRPHQATEPIHHLQCEPCVGVVDAICQLTLCDTGCQLGRVHLSLVECQAGTHRVWNRLCLDVGCNTPSIVCRRLQVRYRWSLVVRCRSNVSRIPSHPASPRLTSVTVAASKSSSSPRTPSNSRSTHPTPTPSLKSSALDGDVVLTSRSCSSDWRPTLSSRPCWSREDPTLSLL
jgi:hypothetical protein